ncbi:MAG TPA: cobalt-precorrin-6A reductase [Solirubrobacteraceae bacterium]|nr:cobalt-precorrin-6A reductase [Solirubrobacteraceae bacterium]
MILLLGGTAEARSLADELVSRRVAVVSSLAGRVDNPRLPRGEVRVGGFGGPRALSDWIARRGVRAVIDATHPFAQRISASAAQACELAGVPLLRLSRPGFVRRPGDRWTYVDELHSAAALVGEWGGRVLLTTGRQGLDAFSSVDSCWFLVRCVQAPSVPLPPRCRLLLDRAPRTLAGELALIDRHRIGVLVTKDSGGEANQPKLDAARERGLPVVLVRRPPAPPVPTVATVEQALCWALGAADRHP